MGGDVRLPQTVDVAEEGSRNVEGNIALADDHCCVATREVGAQVGILGKPIVPAYKCARRVDTMVGGLAGDPEGAVLACAVSEEDCAVVVAKLGEGDVSADLNVTDEVEV